MRCLFVLPLAGLTACVLPPVDLSGRACTTNGACATGSLCVAGGCERACTADADCPAGRTCQGGACLTAPALDRDGGSDAGAVDGGDVDVDAGAPDAGPNEPPTIAAADARTHTDESVALDVTTADPEGAATSVVVAVPPAYGTVVVDGATVSYLPAAGFAGFELFALAADDGAQRSAPVEVRVEVIGRSCVHVQNTGGSIGDGPYTVDLTPDDATDPDTVVFCEMTTAGGGWTLALKVNGEQERFCYDDQLWTDATLYNSDSADLSAVDAKLAPFLTLPADEALLLMDDLVDDVIAVQRLAIPFGDELGLVGLTLRQIFQPGVLQDTPINEAEWQTTLYPSYAGSFFTGREGFNVVIDANQAVRVGQAGQDIAYSDESTIGIGMRGTYCTNSGYDVVVAGLHRDNSDYGTINRAAMGYLFVRNRDFRFLPPAPDCAGHLALGRSMNGTYLVDDGSGGNPAIEMLCTPGDFQRVVVFDAAVHPCPANLVYDPAGPGCVRPSAAGGPVSLSFSVRAPFRELRGVVHARAAGRPDAFRPSVLSNGVDINRVYLDGISITAGDPRVHVFSLAVGSALGEESRCPTCPVAPPQTAAPTFVGANYYCDDIGAAPTFSEIDPLFDFDAQNAACAQVATPNTFQAMLAEENSGPIEVRLMTDGLPTEEDIALLRLELYVR